MGSDLPEWFKDVAMFIVNQHKIHFKKEPTSLEVLNYAWQVISQPKNAAKLECVKPLVEASRKVIEINSQNFDAQYLGVLNQSLKPFKKEGE